LLAGVVLPLLPSGMLSRFSPADAGVAGRTATVTYHAIATAAERWTLSPLLCSALVMLYLLTVLFGVMRLLWRCWRTAAMARRSPKFPLDAADRMRVEGRRGDSESCRRRFAALTRHGDR
jgi:hypothetical protein